MKYCYRCGAPIDDNANFCQNCGTSQKQQQYDQYNQYNQYPQNPQPAKPAVEDKKSFPIALLGFFIPIAGIILYFVWKDETPLKAKSALKGAIVAIVIAVLLAVLFFALSIFLVSSGYITENSVNTPPEYFDIDDFPSEMLRIFNPVL